MTLVARGTAPGARVDAAAAGEDTKMTVLKAEPTRHGTRSNTFQLLCAVRESADMSEDERGTFMTGKWAKRAADLQRPPNPFRRHVHPRSDPRTGASANVQGPQYELEGTAPRQRAAFGRKPNDGDPATESRRLEGGTRTHGSNGSGPQCNSSPHIRRPEFREGISTNVLCHPPRRGEREGATDPHAARGRRGRSAHLIRRNAGAEVTCPLRQRGDCTWRGTKDGLTASIVLCPQSSSFNSITLRPDYAEVNPA
ncbi:hypothetical protein K438DRAFT_1784031 [Mycena galopus ATCC 62051]|nr:hypothetical protein K438DRAFT_1784031 [Mycena galopus ATCC 62051]